MLVCVFGLLQPSRLHFYKYRAAARTYSTSPAAEWSKTVFTYIFPWSWTCAQHQFALSIGREIDWRLERHEPWPNSLPNTADHHQVGAKKKHFYFHWFHSIELADAWKWCSYDSAFAAISFSLCSARARDAVSIKIRFNFPSKWIFFHNKLHFMHF